MQLSTTKTVTVTIMLLALMLQKSYSQTASLTANARSMPVDLYGLNGANLVAHEAHIENSYSIEIADAVGRKLLSRYSITHSNNFSLKGISPGIYSIHLFNNNSIFFSTTFAVIR